MFSGRGNAVVIRSTAGAITSLGLVLLLIAFIVVPAGPVLAAAPELVTSITCEGSTNTIHWTASSSDPSPGGGTADGAVRIIAQRDFEGQITSFLIETGEFNAAN